MQLPAPFGCTCPPPQQAKAPPTSPTDRSPAAPQQSRRHPVNALHTNSSPIGAHTTAIQQRDGPPASPTGRSPAAPQQRCLPSREHTTAKPVGAHTSPLQQGRPPASPTSRSPASPRNSQPCGTHTHSSSGQKHQRVAATAQLLHSNGGQPADGRVGRQAQQQPSGSNSC